MVALTCHLLQQLEGLLAQLLLFELSCTEAQGKEGVGRCECWLDLPSNLWVKNILKGRRVFALPEFSENVNFKGPFHGKSFQPLGLKLGLEISLSSSP